MDEPEKQLFTKKNIISFLLVGILILAIPFATKLAGRRETYVSKAGGTVIAFLGDNVDCSAGDYKCVTKDETVEVEFYSPFGEPGQFITPIPIESEPTLSPTPEVSLTPTLSPTPGFTGVLSGRVTDSLGRGIAGVTINSDAIAGGFTDASGNPTLNCYIGYTQTDQNGSFRYTRISKGQMFCMRAPTIPGYTGPDTSYECQTAGEDTGTRICTGTIQTTDQPNDYTYNFVYNEIPTVPTATPTQSPLEGGN